MAPTARFTHERVCEKGQVTLGAGVREPARGEAGQGGRRGLAPTRMRSTCADLWHTLPWLVLEGDSLLA
jgi:hypothetical protein